MDTYTSVLTEVFKENGEVASKNDIPAIKVVNMAA